MGNIKQEIAKWENRVIYNVAFKEDTKAPLNKLDDILLKSMEKFILIGANSEALVYKIGRYFISKGIKNEDITFIDGRIIESYIGDDKDWKRKERLDEFFGIFGEDYNNKWVLIPLIRSEFSITIALYFITQFRKYKAIGLIFFSEGAANLMEVLTNCSDDPNFYQFPKANFYKKAKRQLADDEW